MNFAISGILVPVDFSAHSELALRYATALASRVGASVDLFHVVEDSVANGAWGSEFFIPDFSEFRARLVEEGQRLLERYRTLVGDAGIPIHTAVHVGQPAQTITEYATTLGADLIVMGTHGRSGLSHLLMGSVAERVIRSAPCPVLTVRDVAAKDHAEPPAALSSALGHLGTSRE